MNKKAELSVQVVFFIVMAIIFAWIIYFGITNIMNLQDSVSETELFETQTKIKNLLEYCDDPLNRGNFRIIEIRSRSFNSLCVIGNQPLTNPALASLGSDLELIREGGDNLVLLKSSVIQSDRGLILSDHQVITTTRVDVSSQRTFCNFDLNGDGVLEVEVRCS